MQMHCPSSLASLKTASCLCKTAQTWREKPANSSDFMQYSGKSLRPGEKIRLLEALMKTTRHHPGFKVTSRKLCLKSAKILYFRYRIFDEIRQIHRIFDGFRQKLQILCRNQARQSNWRVGRIGALAHWRVSAVLKPSIYPVASRVSRAVLEKCGLQASCAY